MAHYDDVIMPTRISYGSSVQDMVFHQPFTGSSGYRSVNRIWSQSLRTLDIRAKKSLSDIDAIYNIWKAVGPENSFLARDCNDWNTAGVFSTEAAGLAAITATDQPLINTTTGTNVGDGTTTTFQLTMQYSEGSASHNEDILKQQSGTVVVAENGVEITPDSISTLGIVTITPAPGSGSPNSPTMTWGGAFYFPVMFAEPFDVSLRNTAVSELPSIPLLQVRL
jgi:uncharacterized protein (TIGR02217 family)